MSKKGYLITGLALLLLIGASIGTALAYFTTSTTSTGDIKVEMGYKAVIEEPKPVEWTKHVTIAAENDSQAVYVRVQAFAGSDLELEISGEGWTQDGDWWYYGGILDGKADTDTPDKSSELKIHIEDLIGEHKAGDKIDVIVVQEYTPVLYEEDGTPYAKWDTEGGN